MTGMSDGYDGYDLHYEYVRVWRVCRRAHTHTHTLRDLHGVVRLVSHGALTRTVGRHTHRITYLEGIARQHVSSIEFEQIHVQGLKELRALHRRGSLTGNVGSDGGIRSADMTSRQCCSVTGTSLVRC